MPAARSAFFLATAIPKGTHFPDFVGTEMLLLGIGEHARQGRNESINLGDGALPHLVKPLRVSSANGSGAARCRRGYRLAGSCGARSQTPCSCRRAAAGA